MAGRRKSEPTPRTKVPLPRPAAGYCPTSVAEASPSDELEGIIVAIQEKYRRKAREQREKTEQTIISMKEQMMQTVEERILQYEEQM